MHRQGPVPRPVLTRLRRRQPKLEIIHGAKDRYVYVEDCDEVWTLAEYRARRPNERAWAEYLARPDAPPKVPLHKSSLDVVESQIEVDA